MCWRCWPVWQRGVCIRASPHRHTGDWGLRDYKLEPQVWGGDAGCEHEWHESTKSIDDTNGLNNSTLTSGSSAEKRRAWSVGKSGVVTMGICRCGA